MNLRAITKEEFDKFNTQISNNASFVVIEKEWYLEEEHNLLGIIVLDNFDKDWSYVIMAREEDGIYRACDVNVSISSISDAKSLLKTNIEKICSDAKIEKEFYNSNLSNAKSSVIVDINDEIKKYLNNHPEKLYELTPRKFEELVADIFKDLGFDVELTKATRDGGRDIIARIKNGVVDFLTYIECKKYSSSNKVGVDIIRKVQGVHYTKNANKSIIVTTSFFTKDAREEAKIRENILDLKDFNDIREWLKKYN